MSRHLCVVTGSRAEWDLLKWLVRALRGRNDVRVSVLATGMHLAPQFGRTVQAILAEGVVPETVDCLVAGDSAAAMAKSVGLGVIGITDALVRLAPDMVVVLGDRFEILAATQAAMLLGLPIAHLHGGELTEGAVDDAIRHAITKMAHLHFTAAADYGRRVIQMGEPPENVHTVGAIGVDAALAVQPLDREELTRRLGGIPPADTTFLVTYHPVTLTRSDDAAAVAAMCRALARHPAARIVVTGVNADAGHAAIGAVLDDFARSCPDRVSIHASLGQALYHAVMREASVVVGNSSSGIIEAPAMGVPTVNIGDRQKGRLFAASVIACAEDEDSIGAALTRALDPAFRAAIRSQTPPYGGGGSAGRIAAILAGADLSAFPRKRFHDLPETAA